MEDMQSVVRISLVSYLLLLIGCAATSVSRQWAGDTGNFAAANYECMRDSRTPYGGSGWGLVAAGAQAKHQARVLYQMCMESKGYQPVCPTGYHLNDDRDKCKPDSEK